MCDDVILSLLYRHMLVHLLARSHCCPYCYKKSSTGAKSLEKKAREQKRGEQRMVARAEPGAEAELQVDGLLVVNLPPGE